MAQIAETSQEAARIRDHGTAPQAIANFMFSSLDD